MANTLVCCGGTGAHVALAFMRLHALGHPLGFFRHGGDEGDPLDLPAIFLVDQDRGDGDKTETAWQALRRVIDGHPSRSEWSDAAGMQSKPKLDDKVVTPLPVGRGQDWSKSRDRLASRFELTDYLACMASPDQQDIRFSLGMMGSPSVGSLLFRLKTYDRREDQHNHDPIFETLMQRNGRIAVAGSAVGGTGSSVTPTLAQLLAEGPDDDDVMAVMILNWFRLDDDPNHSEPETVHKAKRRNLVMVENANSGLMYYGASLAEKVAVVPVGIPEDAQVTRRYEGDTRQSLSEAYPHAVAAMACMDHYLRQNPFVPGLYHMGTADPRKLSGGNQVQGGTLQALMNQGSALANTAHVLGSVLKRTRGKSGLVPVPEVFEKVRSSQAEPRAVGEYLHELVREYTDHLDWLENMGVGKPALSDLGLTREREVRRRLADLPLGLASGTAGARNPEAVAGKLFAWIARYVRDVSRRKSELSPPKGDKRGSYLPPTHGENPLGVAAGEAGELKPANLETSTVIRGFVDKRKISQNGWPHAFSAADYFHALIDDEDPVAQRKLELLLLGYSTGRLDFRETQDDSTETASLDRIISDERQHLGMDLARFRLIDWDPRSGKEQLFGFTSPQTLFCAAPGVPDEAWGRLWSALTGLAAEDWKAESVHSWGRCKTDVEKILAWVAACKQRNRPKGAPPTWTRIFGGSDRLAPRAPAFEAGEELEIKWGDGTVREYLPASQRSTSPIVNRKIPEGNADEFLKKHGRIPDTKDKGKTRFEVIKFQIADTDRVRTVQGIWRQHLESLKKQGKIVKFGPDPRQSDVLEIVVHGEDGTRKLVALPNTRILDRESISISELTPMIQVPMDDAGGEKDDLYPDVPLKSDYFGLLLGEGHDSALDLLKRGKKFELPSPEFADRRSGRVAVWKLRVMGRQDDLIITLPMPPRESRHKAHWMVWPRFRVREPNQWRAYYVYEHCTDKRLRLDTLYLDPTEDRVLVTRNDGGHASYPVRYDVRRKVHTGGAPIAFSLRNRQQERGIFLISLETVDDLSERVSVGVDFGTSHSVGAVKLGKDAAKQIALEPELGEHRSSKPLSMHVSENREHVEDPDTSEGLLARSGWMPTYSNGVKQDLRSLLPTELLTNRPCDEVGKPPEDWVPMLDYVVPPIGIARPDFHEHVIANFKWDFATSFRGNEMALRRIYLDRLVELFAAEILVTHGLPRKPIDFTFTYPLRTSKNDVSSYQELLEGVMARGSHSLGCELKLMDDIGIFDESHAVRVGTDKFGDVCVVGDLGGGTLDLVISATERPGVTFSEAVDSVKIGGNLLLRTLAAGPPSMLPTGWGETSDRRAAQLTAWMRTEGAKALFGRPEGRVAEIENLNLSGFSNARDAAPGRELIHRYFFLVGEYLARSLAAYLANHWYPRVEPDNWKELRLRLYLRGNGWRLWLEDSDYGRVEKVIADRISARLSEAWKLLPINGLPADPGRCSEGGSDRPPKLGTARSVAGESQAYQNVERLSYTMVDLRILRGAGREDMPIPWHRQIPFKTPGEEATKIELANGLRPPIPLNASGADVRMHLDRLEESGERRVNSELDQKEHFSGPDLLDYEAPVGALVWEAAFESDRFRNPSGRR